MSEHLRRISATLTGRYVVEREIGEGGAARVYLAHDVKHDRRVALKVLRPELAASVSAERFEREVRIAAQLRHPNILTLIDSGEVDGQVFYAMPYIAGESLRDVMSRGPVPVAEALRYLRDILDALGYAHRLGIVHRDVKPENVLLDQRHAMVTDFGIALAMSDGVVQGGRRLTVAGRTLGSPTYMAPEQAAGSADADARADLYSFGVVAYELLAGQPPFGIRAPEAMMAAHLFEQPIPLATVSPEVPPALARAVMRCLEKDPKDRWQTAEALLHELDALAVPAGPRPSRRVTPAAVAIAVLSVALVAVGLWGLRAQRDAALQRWAHNEAAPGIVRLLNADSVFAAWRLAQQVETRLPGADAVRDLWPRVAALADVRSYPPGAMVSVAEPGAAAPQWVEVGRTPLAGVRFPRTLVHLRLEMVGHVPVDTVVDSRVGIPPFWLVHRAGQ